MGQLFKIVLSLSISGTLVGGIILLVRPVAKKYFSKRWMYYLWLIVLCRLLLPVHVGVNFMDTLFTAVSERETVQDITEVKKALPSVSEGARETDDSETEGIRTANAVSTTTAGGDKGAKDSGNERARAIFTIAGLIWLMGVLVCALWKICDYRRFVGNISRNSALVTDLGILAAREECLTRLGIKRRVPIYKSSQVNSPMQIGFFGSCIVIPPDMPADITLILYHELMHCKKRDIGYKWLFQVVLCVHWFNPVVYLFQRKFHLDCELACDEAVMKLLTDEGRRAYGDVLLDMAERNIVCRRNVLAMTLMEEKGTLKERLQGIIQYRKRSVSAVICAAVVVVVLLIAALAGGVVLAGSQDRAGKQMLLTNRGDEMDGSLGWVLFSILTGNTGDFLNQEILVSHDGLAYRMYDDDELIADRDENDVWRAWNRWGGERKVNCDGLILNGSDTMHILYTNKDTTIEVESCFELAGGRFKFVHVTPDGKVNILNESGERSTEKITLPQGRNAFKVVGQEARVKNLQLAYSEMTEEDYDGIFIDEEEESEYKKNKIRQEIVGGTVDLAQMRTIIIDMEPEEVSELFKMLLDEDIKLYDADWDAIFTYSDTHMSAQYLAEALREGRAESFYGNGLNKIIPHVSPDDQVEIVTSMQRMSYDTLYFSALALMNKSQCETCIMHYIDLGHTLTDSQLERLAWYVSASGLERIKEYNDEMKQQR
ncbi:MAG: M56 family metallopeptidase [Lachnospiraceae bacterium]|nr:M56 family metallopeptidase [Lachnospiraceae bacterium]